MKAKRLGAAPHLRSVVDNDGGAILDLEQGVMLNLNCTGSYIWEELRRGKLIDEVVSDLSRDTGVNTSVVQRDVHDFVRQLKSMRLLTDTGQ